MAENTSHQLSIVEESAYGATPTTPAFQILRNTGCTLKMTRASVDNPEIRADRQHAGMRLGSFSIAGNVSGVLSFLTYSALLEAGLTSAFQIDTPSAGTDQLKNGVARKSFTFERYFSDQLAAANPYHRYHGVEVSGLSIKGGPDSNVEITAELIGQSESRSGVALTGASYAPQTADDPMTMLGGNVLIGGVSSGVVTSFDISVKNAMNANPVATDNFGLRPSIGPIDVTGSIAVYFEGDSNISALANETETSIDVSFTDGVNIYRILMPRVKFTDAGVESGGTGTFIETIPFRALPDAATSATIIIEEM